VAQAQRALLEPLAHRAHRARLARQVLQAHKAPRGRQEGPQGPQGPKEQPVQAGLLALPEQQELMDFQVLTVNPEQQAQQVLRVQASQAQVGRQAPRAPLVTQAPRVQARRVPPEHQDSTAWTVALARLVPLAQEAQEASAVVARQGQRAHQARPVLMDSMGSMECKVPQAPLGLEVLASLSD
jgi:hypothetical protein